MPSVFQTEAGGGGGGEAVSSGSTWLWSSLDQGPGLDMNIERSSPRTAQPVTLLQDRLTDNALTVSLPAFEWPLKTGRYRRVEERGSGPPSSFCLHADRSKTSSSQFGLCTSDPPFICLCSSFTVFVKVERAIVTQHIIQPSPSSLFLATTYALPAETEAAYDPFSHHPCTRPWHAVFCCLRCGDYFSQREGERRRAGKREEKVQKRALK